MRKGALAVASGALRAVYSGTTQLNSTDPVEKRSAKSVVFLFMTSRPTNWVNLVTTFIDKVTVVHAVNVSTTRRRIELSWFVSL